MVKRVVIYQGGSPGLVVMGDNLCLGGLGFESRCHILDGQDFFTLNCSKNCIVCLKRQKINGKEAGVGPVFFKKNVLSYCTYRILIEHLTN